MTTKSPVGFLNEMGELKARAPKFARDNAALVEIYRAMARTRAFDEKAIALQRTGRLGTYASSLGQEAAAVGIAAAMQAEDVLLPSFREHGAQLWRGVTPVELMLYWGGDERGSDFSGPRGDFPVCIPVGSQYPHAAGVAYAFQVRGEARAAVVVGGDGSTSKGDFYEALNVVGAWKLPAVFVICNNQWAISTPRAEQTAARTIAEKSVAAGLPGEVVDGNDVIAVRDTVSRALARARGGEGGALIELATYRLSDHTTADDASRYRDEAAVSKAWKHDPLARLRTYLVNAGGWSARDEDALLTDLRAEMDTAAETYLATAPQSAASMIDWLYAELPAELAAQRARLAEAPE